MSWFSQEVSRQASKKAADYVMNSNDGVEEYTKIGYIFTSCGVVWLLISIIPFMCGWCSVIECLLMGVPAPVFLIIGVLLIILCKKSRSFQEWADKAYKRDMVEIKKLQEKVKIGKLTLPITNGDILSFKILGVFCIILVCIILIANYS